MRRPEDTADAVMVTGDAIEELAPVAAVPSPPASAIVAVTLAGIGAFLNLYTTQPLLPTFAALFHASKAAVGMTISAATLGVAFSAPFCGLLAERIGRRRVIVTATLVLAIPTMLAATAASLDTLIVWRLLQGIVMPGVFGVTIAYITEEWPAGEVARVMSVYVSGTVLGGFLGRFLPGVAPTWRWGFIVIGALDLLFGVVLAQWLPPDQTNPRPEARGPRPALFGRRLLATYIVGFNVLFSLAATFTYITFHLAAPPYRMTPAHLSLLFMVYLVGLVVTPLGGLTIARAGSRATLIGALIASMSGVALTLAAPLPLIVIGLTLCSSGVFVCQAASTSYIHSAAPAGGRSAAAGMYVAAYYIGGSAAGVVPGFFWQFGGWTACVLLVIAVQAVTIAIAAIAWK
ncbi:MAG TPA: MFS transporter [Thermoanaerobaculia bacterium]|nr:MFS transporter [Thermoanaerobaculia bacterium]